MLCVKYNSGSARRSGFQVADVNHFKSLGYNTGNIIYSIDGLNEYSYDPKIYSYSFIKSIDEGHNEGLVTFFGNNCDFPLFSKMTSYQRTRVLFSISTGVTEGDFVMESVSGDKIYKLDPKSVYIEHDCRSFTIRHLRESSISAIKVKMNGGSSFHIAGKLCFDSDQSIKTEFGDFIIDRSELTSNSMANIIALFPEAAFHRKTDYSISSF